MAMVAGAARLGIDVGEQKTIGVVIDGDGRALAERCLNTPEGDGRAVVAALAGLVVSLCDDAAIDLPSVGLAVAHRIERRAVGRRHDYLPPRIEPALPRELAATIGREVRSADKASCLALAERDGGVAADGRRMFAAVLGRSLAGAVMCRGELLGGMAGSAGAWAHVSLPWPTDHEIRHASVCDCGHSGCIESWLSGPAMSADYLRRGASRADAADIVARAEAGERLAGMTLRDWLSRVARGLAMIVHLLDPEIIVLGGGLARIRWLYTEVPKIWAGRDARPRRLPELRPATTGDAAIARGAAALSPPPKT